MAIFNFFKKGEASNDDNNKKTRPAAPAPVAKEGLSNKVALGAGCYWGTEKYVRQNFQEKFPGSIKSAKVGFMSPFDNSTIKNPTYEQVCSGQSGHVEVLMVELNEPEKHFEELIRFFFQFHDPTTKNRQGNDVGFQYASFIFCGDEEQYNIAKKVKDELQQLLNAGALRAYARDEVTTYITPIHKFTAAHAAHQRYLENNPNGYCNHRMRFKMWPELVNNNKATANTQESEATTTTVTEVES
ncbi:hypothetical protein ACA910_007991 [Epithemia clementina (nom. ined.)]